MSSSTSGRMCSRLRIVGQFQQQFLPTLLPLLLVVVPKNVLPLQPLQIIFFRGWQHRCWSVVVLFSNVVVAVVVGLLWLWLLLLLLLLLFSQCSATSMCLNFNGGLRSFLILIVVIGVVFDLQCDGRSTIKDSSSVFFLGQYFAPLLPPLPFLPRHVRCVLPSRGQLGVGTIEKLFKPQPTVVGLGMVQNHLPKLPDRVVFPQCTQPFHGRLRCDLLRLPGHCSGRGRRCCSQFFRGRRVLLHCGSTVEKSRAKFSVVHTAAFVGIKTAKQHVQFGRFQHNVKGLQHRLHFQRFNGPILVDIEFFKSAFQIHRTFRTF